MLGKLVDGWKSRRATHVLEEHPLFGPALMYLRGVMADRTKGIGKYWSDERKPGLIQDVLADIERAIQSDPGNPAHAIRMRTVEHMQQCAAYQVLIIDPPPAEDPTGMRRYRGVSGELKEQLARLVDIDDGLRTYFAGMAHPLASDKERWDYVLARHWVLHLYLNTFNQVRCAIGDRHPDPTRDWLRPAFTSLCVWQEDTYRKKLGLPSHFPQEGEMSSAPLTHWLWMKRASEGHRDLLAAWNHTWREVHRCPSPYEERPFI